MKFAMKREKRFIPDPKVPDAASPLYSHLADHADLTQNFGMKKPAGLGRVTVMRLDGVEPSTPSLKGSRNSTPSNTIQSY